MLLNVCSFIIKIHNIQYIPIRNYKKKITTTILKPVKPPPPTTNEQDYWGKEAKTKQKQKKRTGNPKK